MPATIDFQDMSVVVTPPGGYLEPLPLTMGPAQRANDVRILFVSGSESAAGGVSEAVQMNPDPPTGFTGAYTLNPGFETRGVYTRTLPAGATDTSVAWIKPSSWRDFLFGMVSARGVDPATAPVAGDLTSLMTHNVQDSTLSIGSVTVPAPGVMVYCLWLVGDPEGNWPSWASAAGCPASGGWKNLVATDKSGQTYYSYDVNPSALLIGNKYASSGSTGTVTVPVGVGSHAFAGMYCFLRPAPDGSSTGSAVTSTAVVGTPSSSSATNPASVGTPVTTTASLSCGFNPLIGYLITDPYTLNGAPVSASIVEWTAVTPAGSEVTVETSINNMLSWDVATNGGPIPRLREGDTTTRTVHTRVTFTRQSAGGGVPRLQSLRVDPYCAVVSDELIPTFYGQVDKTTTKITAGSSGGTAGGSNGAGVSSKGGGLFGGGAMVKVHAADPSRLIKLAQWEQVFSGPTGVTYDQLGRAMVLDRRPNQALFNQVSTSQVVDDSLLVWGLGQGASDPWQDIRGVFTQIGQECFFDVIGAFNSRPVPDPRSGAIVWEFDHTVRPTIIGSESELDTSLITNGFVIIGQSTTSANPVNAFAFNTDTASKYNIYPPPVGIGKRIQKLKFSLAQTADQCQAIANGLLFNSLGMANTVTIGIVPHPGIAAGDVARINSPETGVVGRFLIQGYTLPDSPGEQMQLTCFRQTDNP